MVIKCWSCGKEAAAGDDWDASQIAERLNFFKGEDESFICQECFEPDEEDDEDEEDEFEEENEEKD